MGRSAKSASPAIRATETALPDRASASAQPTGPPPAIATSTSGGSTTANQCLDIPDRLRCCCRQHLAPGGCYDDVVLDAYARVPELSGHVPRQFWNTGVRIEDDVVVTASGCEVLTAAAPKSVRDIEALVGRG